MANKNEIRIESILGGISDYTDFSTSDQFSFSSGINPDIEEDTRTKPNGLINATMYGIHATTSAFPMWLVTTPKNNEVYVYDAGGTIYSTTVDDSYATEITTLASSVGGGSAYYDNYVYFATNSTVARFGPLNQDSPAINADFWGNSLGKTTLNSTVYPTFACYDPLGSPTDIPYPNHIMHRHSNGKLYFADVVGNQGVLHCISTKKTTIEGDTDDGSTYNAIDFPPGMWPTAISSYGSDLAVALYEGNTTQNTKQRARVAFWDTTNPDNYYQITSTEFPDSFISAMVNSNGVLYVFSGPNTYNFYNNYPAEAVYTDNLYTRVSRFVGGYTFEQIAYLPGSLPPTQAGADGMLNKIIFSGTHDAFSFTSDYDGSHYGGYNTIYSIGSKVSGISKVLNSIIPTTVIEQATFNPFGPVKYVYDGYLDRRLYFGGMYYNTLSSDSRYAIFSTDDGVYTNIGYNLVGCWKSQLFRIGRPFKVTKVKIGVEFGWSIIISVDCDSAFYGKNKSYKAKDITYSDFVSTHSTITQQFENATGWSNFNLSIYFYKTTSSYVPTGRIALPIIIEYEILDD